MAVKAWVTLRGRSSPTCFRTFVSGPNLSRATPVVAPPDAEGGNTHADSAANDAKDQSIIAVFAAGGVFFCRRWLCLCMLFCYKSEYSCAAYALNDDDDECKNKK